MRHDAVTGWDLGGAHLKAAAVNGDGSVERVIVLPCPLWLGMHHLEAAAAEALALLKGGSRRHALTLTGELADIFRDRREGVRTLVQFMAARLPDKELLVYAGSAGFCAPDAVAQRPEQVASANWLAAATYTASRLACGLFVDIGSTTTDIVLVSAGRVHNRGYTDHERLHYEEIVYTGAVRTPVAALAERVPFAGEWMPLMAEQFATTADVHRLTSALPANADLLPAADNGPKTMEGSARRLARMIGFDGDAAPLIAWRRLACYVSELQLRRVQAACERALSRGVVQDPVPIIGAGVGRFLAQQLSVRLRSSYVDFGSLVQAAELAERTRAADCAPAVAVAQLARTWA
ncbi:MAG: hydantoinase/oxoprolinase family protein [Sulfurifustaceae bacterium]